MIGFLEGGIGDAIRKNYLTNKISHQTMIDKFINEKDISIILITNSIAEMIRPTLDKYNRILPYVIEIPSRDQSYTDKDSMMINKLSTYA